MKYIKINKNQIDEQVKEVVEVIKNGGIVVIPTDTVYGISADALNEKAVEKIYKIKKRKPSNPCSILVSNLDMIKKVTKNISCQEEKIINNFFPGPLTLVIEKNEQIPDIVTSGLNTIGVRMPQDEFLLKVIEMFGSPIVATSLNLVGEKAKTSIDINDEILKKADCVVDNGPTKIGVASTVVRLDGKDIKIIREGPIKKDMLQKAIEEEI